MGLLMGLVALNNLIDYRANWLFVQHVMRMDTIAADSTQRWRAVSAEPVQRLAYAAIIAVEGLSAVLLAVAAVRLFQRARDAASFERAAPLAVAGLTLAMLLYAVGFLAGGGEWFLMWQSKTWSGSDAAGRFFLVMAAVLLLLLSGRADAG